MELQIHQSSGRLHSYRLCHDDAYIYVMCGINGIYNKTRNGLGESIVSGMCDAMAHRGPDAEGSYHSDGIALGHRRLAIIDLSEAGVQPFYSADKRYVMVFNGEIYNYRELRQELPELHFTTDTDTEVLLALWIKWGIEGLHRLNGMFAFAVYDTQEHALHIVRDRLGIKPLYIYEDDHQLLFSSEIRALLSSGKVPREMDRDSLGEYIRYQTVYAPRTIIKNVSMLMPGQVLSLTKEKSNYFNWWKPTIQPREDSFVAASRNVRELLRSAVEYRLVADVPFGAFLSGGIDSSVVVGLMSEVSSRKVNTFNVSFDESEFSEAKYAAAIAKKFNTQHHEIRLTPADFLCQLPDALVAIDHPSGDGPNSFVVSKATKKAGITMALSGLGGDELFAGYDIFKRTKRLQQSSWITKSPSWLRNIAATALQVTKKGVASQKMQSVLREPTVNFNSFYPYSREVLSRALVKQMLTQGSYDDANLQALLQSIRADEQHEISRVSVAEIQTYMQNILLRDTDQMSMAVALEVRVPFLDYRLVEYVLGLSDDVKYPHTPKRLLVDSCKDLLPDEIVNRPKMGFTLPFANWMRNELKSWCENRLQHLSQHEAFRGEVIQELWNRFLNKDPQITWSRIWHLVVLADWMEKNEIQ